MSSLKRRQWKGPNIDDFRASLVVFLVALPLCMGIAIASGVPPALGLITGVIGGLLVGFIQGSPLQVSGPAAGLVVLVVGVVQDYGLESLGIVVFLAGVLQLIAGIAGGGRWFRAVPPSVVSGMLAGIGILIFSSQFHVMIDDAPRSSGMANILAIPEAISKAVSPQTSLVHREAAGLGILTISMILLWIRFCPPRIKSYLPGPLVGVVAAGIVASVFSFSVAYVRVPADMLGSLNIPEIPSFDTLVSLFGVAIGVALVASAESLLCASAVDKMHHGPRTNYNRELAAQGIGNILCGCLGAIPMTGVIVRSSANAEAGAKTRWSTILHGVWILLLVGGFSQLLTKIPVASLAAVLVYLGAKLASPTVLMQLKPYGRGEIAIFIITAVTVVVGGLLTGVLCGFALAVWKLLLRLSKLEIQVEDSEPKNRTIIHLIGSATFIRLADIAETLDRIEPSREVHLQFDRLEHVDHAVIELFQTWGKQHNERGGGLVLDWNLFERRYHSVNGSPS